MNANVAEKPLLHNTLRRFERICPENACVEESGFVNHSAVTVPNQFVQRRFFPSGSRIGAPPLSPRGEEGDWHARIAD
jgi:hypothetical protein